MLYVWPYSLVQQQAKHKSHEFDFALKCINIDVIQFNSFFWVRDAAV